MKTRKVLWTCGMLTGLAAAFSPVHAQRVAVVTGQGTSDASGVPASSARMLSISTNVSAPDGTLYFTEQSGRVRKITPDGLVHTIAGRDTFNCSFSGDNGPAASARLCYPSGIARDAGGNLYIGDSGNNRIRKISTAGVITTIAGNGVDSDDTYGGGFSGDGGQARNAQLSWPSWMAFDANGNLYFSDEGNNRVRKITPLGVISTVAGSGQASFGHPVPSFSGDGGPATNALLDLPQGLAIDSSRNLYIADHGNHRIRKVTPGGTISTVAGSGPVGANLGAFSGDGGSALLARLNRPMGLAIDRAGNLYLADQGNNRVRKIDPAGTIRSVAGNGTALVTDGAEATQTGVPPWSVSTDASGDLHVDTLVNKIVKIDMPNLDIPNERVVDDGSALFRPVASNTSAVFNSLSQTFTAEWSRTAFGFRIRNFSGTPGKQVVMNLYRGENSYSNLLATRLVTIPVQASSDPRSANDVGFVMADFSDVDLRVGDQYTVEITLPSADLPAPGEMSNIGVWGSVANPYMGGRFYYRCCFSNDEFENQDKLFRMAEVAISGPVGTARGVEEEIVEAMDDGAISSAIAGMLLDALAPIQTNLAWIAANPSDPGLALIKSETCALINRFIVKMDHYYRLRRLPVSYRDAWKADMLEVKASLGCAS